MEALEEKHTGSKLVTAIVDFAETLTKEDRRVLQDVLLKRRRPLRIPRKPPPEDAEG